jgi:hypothetical protein
MAAAYWWRQTAVTAGVSSRSAWNTSIRLPARSPWASRAARAQSGQPAGNWRLHPNGARQGCRERSSSPACPEELPIPVVTVLGPLAVLVTGTFVTDFRLPDGQYFVSSLIATTR